MTSFIFFVLSTTITLISLVSGEICPDGNLCSHGSKCIKIEKGYMSKIPGRKYRCDCSYDLTIGQDFYAGYSCEYAATDYCTDGFYANQEQKSKAFCTNGSCVNNIFIAQENQKQEFYGCDCNAGYEGKFCEFRKGRGIVRVSKVVRSAVVISIVIISILTAAVGFCWYRRKKMIAYSSPNSNDCLEMKTVDADII